MMQIRVGTERYDENRTKSGISRPFLFFFDRHPRAQIGVDGRGRCDGCVGLLGLPVLET